MSKRVLVCLCAVVALATLIGALVLRPTSVLAATGTVSMETPLHDSPDPAAPVIALLSEGTVVSIDGPPVDGFYPVTVGDLFGWMRGETLEVEKDAPESEVAEEGDPLVTETGETVPEETPAEVDPATEPPASATLDPASDPVLDTSVPAAESSPVADPALGNDATSVAEPVLVEEVPAVTEPAPGDESVPVGEPTPQDGAGVEPTPDPESAAAPVPVAPDGESAPAESVANPSDVAAEPTMDPNVTPISAPEIAPVGPASVVMDAPIRTGPGPGFDLIVTAPAGSAVLQTGHVIDGYVTVQSEEVTGWVALEHLGAPGTPVEETLPGEATVPTETSPSELPPSELPPSETVPVETVPVEAAPVEVAPVEAAPVDTAAGDAAPVDAA